MHEYLDGAGLANDPKAMLFQTYSRATGQLTGNPLPQANAYAMIQRRAKAAGITTQGGNHTFRATGVTAYLKNGGTLEKAAQMANHASAPPNRRMLDLLSDRGKGFGAFDNSGPEGDAAALSKAFKQAAISAYGTVGPAFVRRVIAEGADEIGGAVRNMVANFKASEVPARSDGQVDRAADRLGLIAAAGELATAMGLEKGEARAAAAWALRQWIDRRGGIEPAEIRQAIETVRLFIEQYGESRFDPLDDTDARPVNNRAG